MQRDDFACQHCGDKTTTLNVHHTSYRSGVDPWEYADEGLSTLCESCHLAEHTKLTPMPRTKEVGWWWSAFSVPSAGEVMSPARKRIYEIRCEFAKGLIGPDDLIAVWNELGKLNQEARREEREAREQAARRCA